MIDFGYGLTLGPLDSGYLETIRGWRNSPAIWKWCRQFNPITDAGQDAWFDRQGKDPSIQMYAVLAADVLVGVCGLTSIDLVNRRAEFSLYIAPDMHGKGLGTRALKTLLSHGFKNWGLNSIWGETFEGNSALRLFESVGMKKEGIRRDFYFRDGRFIGAHLVSALASEWRA